MPANDKLAAKRPAELLGANALVLDELLEDALADQRAVRVRVFDMDDDDAEALERRGLYGRQRRRRCACCGDG